MGFLFSTEKAINKTNTLFASFHRTGLKMAPLPQMVQPNGTSGGGTSMPSQPSPSSGASNNGAQSGGVVVSMASTVNGGSPQHQQQQQQQQHPTMGTSMTDGCGKVITGYGGSPFAAQQLHHAHHHHHHQHQHHQHAGSNGALNTVLTANVQYEHGKYAAN